jgi:hypothetical protein
MRAGSGTSSKDPLEEKWQYNHAILYFYLFLHVVVHTYATNADETPTPEPKSENEERRRALLVESVRRVEVEDFAAAF